MLGTLEPRKNLPLALDAIRILRERRVDVRLVLAGGRSNLIDLPAMLRERNLGSPEVVCTGYVDDARIASLLAGARLLVFPSLYEGFGMPLLEAMQAGVPIVAARAGATPEVLGDAGIMVDPDDAGAFADTIEQVLVDEELRTTLIKTGYERCQEFTWARAAEACLRLYRQVAA
jgi:alpha-1,3-rhamnosyl/mannosyltransferase